MPSRRRYLALLAATAGCAGRPGTTPGRSPTDSPTDSATRTGTPTESPHPPTETPLPTAAPPDSVDGAWTHPLRDPGHTGTSVGATLPGPGEKPGVVWQAHFDGAPGAPVVTDGTVLLTPGSRLVALDARTGAEQWSRSFDDAGADVGTVTVTGDRAVFLVGTDLVAVSTADGSTAWRTTAAGVNPTVGSDAVYTVDGGTLVSRSIATGEERWRKHPEGVNRLNRPAPVGDAVYVSDAASAGKVHALAAADGSTRWTASRPSHPTAVTVRGDRVYAGGFYGIVAAFAVDDGRTVWAENAGPPVGRILAGPDAIYAAGTGGDVALGRLETGSGATGWTSEAGYPLAATRDAVLVDVGEEVRALDAATGAGRWAVPIDTRAAAVVDDVVFLTTESSVLAVR